VFVIRVETPCKVCVTLCVNLESIDQDGQILFWDDGNIGNVLSPHEVSLMESVEPVGCEQHYRSKSHGGG
jgi:hypothetical protein